MEKLRTIRFRLGSEVEKNKQLRAENERLKKVVQEKDELIYAYERTRSPVIDDTIQRLRAENKRLQRAVCPMKQQLAGAVKHIELKKKIDELEEEKERIRTDNEQLRAENKSLRDFWNV